MAIYSRSSFHEDKNEKPLKVKNKAEENIKVILLINL